MLRVSGQDLQDLQDPQDIGASWRTSWSRLGVPRNLRVPPRAPGNAVRAARNPDSPVPVSLRLSVCLWFRRRRGLSVPSKLTVARRGGILRPVRTTEYVGVFDIKTKEMTEGDLPGIARGLVTDWLGLHQEALEEMWRTQVIVKLPPLEK